MGKQVKIILCALFCICTAAASFLYYEKIVIPKQAAKERVSNINKLTSSVSKEFESFVLKINEAGVSYREVFNSADESINNIDSKITMILMYRSNDNDAHYNDSIEYAKNCRTIIRNIKIFLSRMIITKIERETIENSLEKIKHTHSKEHFKFLLEKTKKDIAENESHNNECANAAKSINDHKEMLEEIGRRNNIDSQAIVSKQALDLTTHIVRSEIAKDMESMSKSSKSKNN